jgi:hypothetical protein
MLRLIAARVAGRDGWFYLMEKKAPGETRGFLGCSWPAFASCPVDSRICQIQRFLFMAAAALFVASFTAAFASPVAF